MSFKDYFDDISNMINETRSGTEVTSTVFGYNWEEYVNGELGPVNFWTDTPINESMDDLGIIFARPLIVETTDYEMGDIFFETKCVGYAVENDYDSVIIETADDTFYITIDFDESASNMEQYITEAGKKRSGPLAGKRISPEKRAELKRGQVSQKKHDTLRRPTTTNKPKKSPPKGMKVDVLLANTGKLSPDRVERAMKQVRKQPPKVTGVKEVQGQKYFRAEYNFKSAGSSKRQFGYADISQDKQYCTEMFCTCSDFFYRLYAPYVAAGLSSWNIPAKFKGKQSANVGATHNHKWTVDTNPMGKLFLCKHLWAFMAYYITGSAGNVDLSDEEIEKVVQDYFGDTDGDGDEEPVDTEFKKAFGKLYVGQQGKEIEDIQDPEEAKKQKGSKQTYYQLPKGKKPAEEPDTDEEETEEEE